jgi:hypothetical protein
MLQVVRNHPNLDALYGSSWWKQAEAKAVGSQSLALAMLDAATWTGELTGQDPEYQRLSQSFVDQGWIKARAQPIERRDDPPRIEDLMRMGINVDPADFDGSMRPFLAPTLPTKANDTSSGTVLARYNHMASLRLNWGTYPKALIVYREQLKLTPSDLMAITIISNHKPNQTIDQKKIAKSIGVSLRTIKRILKNLQRHGLMKVITGSGYWEANQYDLSPLWKKLDELDAKALAEVSA